MSPLLPETDPALHCLSHSQNMLRLPLESLLGWGLAYPIHLLVQCFSLILLCRWLTCCPIHLGILLALSNIQGAGALPCSGWSLWFPGGSLTVTYSEERVAFAGRVCMLPMTLDRFCSCFLAISLSVNGENNGKATGRAEGKPLLLPSWEPTRATRVSEGAGWGGMSIASLFPQASSVGTPNHNAAVVDVGKRCWLAVLSFTGCSVVWTLDLWGS